MGLRTKTFVVMLLVSAGIAGLALSVQQQTVRSNFREYLLAARQMQAEQLAEELAQTYAQLGDWDLVVRQAWRWPEMFPPKHRPRAPDNRRPPPRAARPPRNAPPHRRESRPRPADENAAPASDSAQVRSDKPAASSQVRQFTLYDSQRETLTATDVQKDADKRWHAITLQQQTIGWLSWLTPEAQEHPLDAMFWAEQRRNMLMISGMALVVATLAAWIFSGLLLGRIRRLSGAVSRVADGDHGTAVADASADELGELARNFNTMSHRLQQAREREQQWLADIAHELRTPLAVLRGELEALQDGIRQNTPAAMTSLQDEVTHLSRLIDDLHLLSSSESGQLALQCAPTDLNVLIRSIAHNHKHALQTRQLDLQLELPASLSACVDEHRIRQVLDNLLVNVCRYATPGRVVVQARSSAAQLVLSVADSGPGLSPNEREQLFNRLYRTDTARSRERGGSGLGLAICRGIIVAHGGQISASRSAAGGLQITIHLPRKPEAG